MTTSAMGRVGAPPTAKQIWKAIDWRHIREEVCRLQVRIAKAVRGNLPTAGLRKQPSLLLEPDEAKVSRPGS